MNLFYRARTALIGLTLFLGATLALVSLNGCASVSRKSQKVESGTLIGAGQGAVVGSATGQATRMPSDGQGITNSWGPTSPQTTLGPVETFHGVVQTSGTTSGPTNLMPASSSGVQAASGSSTMTGMPSATPQAPVCGPMPSGLLQPPCPMVKPPATTTQVTIANIRKETGLLFKVADQGELTFVQKVAHGEAVDLETVTGQRWVVVFVEQPHHESRVIKQENEVWLLRGPATPANVPCAPYSPTARH